MSKTIKHSAVPRSGHQNSTTKKFFGWRDGYTDGMSNPKKGQDFINYGYPSEFRSKAEIVKHDEAQELKDILEELIET